MISPSLLKLGSFSSPETNERATLWRQESPPSLTPQGFPNWRHNDLQTSTLDREDYQNYLATMAIVGAAYPD